jgi:hypothetical protein
MRRAPSANRRRFRDYFFSYSWDELRNVDALRDTWVAIYVVLGVVGFIAAPFESRGYSALCFAALSNYPGYLLGLMAQRRVNPQSLVEAELMVWQLGNLSKVLSAAGILLLVRELV